MTTTEVASTVERPPNGLMRRLSASAATHVGSRLFRKYVALFVAVVCVALLTNGLFEIWFSYRRTRQALTRIQREQAEAAAAKIGQFIKEIEARSAGPRSCRGPPAQWTSAASTRLRLLRQVPAITELAQLDSSGREQLRVSRLAMDVVAVGPTSAGAEIRRGGGEEGLLRPGLFPPRVRALHDARRSPAPAATPASASPR